MQNHEKIKMINTVLNRNSKLCEEWAKQKNINYHTFLTFYSLYEQKKLTQKQIADSHRLLKQTVNNIITDLKKNDYVVLMTDPSNKREKLVELTNKGMQFAKKYVAPFMDMENIVMERMGEEKAQQMIEAMQLYGDLFKEEMNKCLED